MPGKPPLQTRINAHQPRSRRDFLTHCSTAGSFLLASQLPGWAHAQDENTLPVPVWDDVPGCTASSTDSAVQGPFFIHDDERGDDISLFRQDIRGQYDPAAEPGTEMHLHLRILDSSAAECRQAPVSGIVVYIWHCDAQGFYSGFGESGEQQPDRMYRGRPGINDLDNDTRFCRGAALTDANGVVSFRSIFPGWYNGRDIHIHFLAMHPNAVVQGRRFYREQGHIFTTQLYFEPELIDRVHQAAQPYRRRTSHPAYPGVILGDERGNSGLRFKADYTRGLVTAQMQILLDPARSVAGSGGWGMMFPGPGR